MPPMYSYSCSECGGEIELLLHYSERYEPRTHSMEDCPGQLKSVVTSPNFLSSRSASYLDGQIPAERKKEFDALRINDKLTVEKADLMTKGPDAEERKSIDREMMDRDNHNKPKGTKK